MLVLVDQFMSFMIIFSLGVGFGVLVSLRVIDRIYSGSST